MKKRRMKWNWLILIFGMAMFLVACQKTTETEKQVDMDRLQKQLLEADTTLPEMIAVTSEEENAELNFSALCDFSYDRVENYFYLYAEDGTAPEIAVVELKDASDAAALMMDIKEHAANREGTMQSYMPDQVEIVHAYILTYDGPYVLYAVGEQNGMVQKAFEAAFEE